MTNWDQRLLSLAQHIATWSKDPSTKVGAVIVDQDRRIVSCGYNGVPRGVQEAASREDKLLRTIHAEANALHFASNVTGCTLYVTAQPCAHCAGHIIQRGIARVVCFKPSEDYMQRWYDSLWQGVIMFEEAKVKIDIFRNNI